MKLRLLFALLIASIIAPSGQAAPAKRGKVKTVDPFSIAMRDAKPPLVLVKKLGGSKLVVLRSGLAPLGLKHESCWFLWTATLDSEGAKTWPMISVWQPTGKNRWTRLGEWPLDNFDPPKEAQFFWLNSKTRTGWVMKIRDVLFAWPQGVRTKRDSLYKEAFEGNATSIYATYYQFNVDKDKRGLYTVTKIYSEPGMNEKGETINVDDRTVYPWNGKGWIEIPKG